MDHALTYLVPVITAFNVVILSYFLVGNGIYTILMLLSLRATLAHVRRMTYQGLDALRLSPLTPPVTIIIPAWNEQEVIVDSVISALQSDYPQFDIIVVDDGSTDLTLDLLIGRFGLVEIDRAYHPRLATAPVRAFYINPHIPNLLVASKMQGGKPDALNAGINLCRSPYFCNLDADCLLERDALLRLMDPIVNSAVQTVVSGGIVRILNGCETKHGRVSKSACRQTGWNDFQVVEYLRSFLFGRNGLASAGWHLDRLGGVRGLPSRHRHRGGRFLPRHGNRRHGPDCSTPSVGGGEQSENPHVLHLRPRVLDRVPHHARRAGPTAPPLAVGSLPDALETLGNPVRKEVWNCGLAQLSLPLLRRRAGRGGGIPGLSADSLGRVPGTSSLPGCSWCYLLLGFIYGGFLSVGAVLLEELTYRRYPRFQDLLTLLVLRHVRKPRLPPVGFVLPLSGCAEIFGTQPPLGKGGARRSRRGGMMRDHSTESERVAANSILEPLTEHGDLEQLALPRGTQGTPHPASSLSHLLPERLSQNWESGKANAKRKA